MLWQHGRAFCGQPSIHPATLWELGASVLYDWSQDYWQRGYPKHTSSWPEQQSQGLDWQSLIAFWPRAWQSPSGRLAAFCAIWALSWVCSRSPLRTGCLQQGAAQVWENNALQAFRQPEWWRYHFKRQEGRNMEIKWHHALVSQLSVSSQQIWKRRFFIAQGMQGSQISKAVYLQGAEEFQARQADYGSPLPAAGGRLPQAHSSSADPLRDLLESSPTSWQDVAQ